MAQFTVVATAIIHRNGSYLVLQRAHTEEKFPGMWTVPGGTLELSDYEAIVPNKDGVRYEILERLVRREVEEETGLEIRNIRYLTSLAYPKKSGPALCISLLADYAGGTLLINDEHIDAVWITAQQATGVPLISGIHEELLQAEDVIEGKPIRPWSEYEEIVRTIKK